MSKQKEISPEEKKALGMVQMMFDGMTGDLTIHKVPGHDRITLEGGTNNVITDLYLVIKSLEIIIPDLMPMLKPGTDIKELLKGIIDQIQIEDEEEEDEE